MLKKKNTSTIEGFEVDKLKKEKKKRKEVHREGPALLGLELIQSSQAFWLAHLAVQAGGVEAEVPQQQRKPLSSVASCRKNQNSLPRKLF